MNQRKRTDPHHAYFQRVTGSRYRSLNKRSPASFTLHEFRAWLREQLSGEQGQTFCEYCGCRLSVETLQVDHRLPIAQGGLSSLANLAISCQRDNNRKGALSHLAYQHLLSLLNTKFTFYDRDNILHRLEVADRLANSRQRSLRHARVRYTPHFEQRPA